MEQILTASRAWAPVALGLLMSSAFPPNSEGSKINARDADPAGDAPLMWTNVHTGDIILDTRIRDWVCTALYFTDVFNTKFNDHEVVSDLGLCHLGSDSHSNHHDLLHNAERVW